MNLAGLVVALGNPGNEYKNTRHNLGWLVLDQLISRLERSGVQVHETKGPKGAYNLWRAKVKGQEWLFCKPLTYMNLSGEAVAPLANFYRIEPENLLVLHDEIDLPLGRVRIKKGGGTAGHNGLKSLAQCLGSKDFVRLRLGVGKPERGEVANYVLAKFASSEQADLEQVLDFAVESVYSYMISDFASVLQAVNSFKLDSQEGESKTS